jgi:PilZ domain
MPADQNYPDQEHRAADRRRALLSARIVCGDGAFTLDATIRNISQSGALVNVPRRQHVPDRVFLIDLKAMIAYNANVVRRSNSVIGLTFITEHPISELSGSNLGYLRRIWVDAVSR